MDLVKTINGLIDFSAVGDAVNPILGSLPFHFVPHPAIVHFALVLPILALLFQVMGLFTKNETTKRAANYLFFFGVTAILLAAVSGRLAGSDVAPNLSGEGKELFNEHLELGFALAVFYLVLLLLKVISIFAKNRIFRGIMAILMIAGVAGLVVQAQHGGELVYKHAAGVTVPDAFADDDDEE